MDVVLYYAPGSNSSERIEWILQHKGIRYRKVDVSDVLKSDEYKRVNPFGYVPSVQLGDTMLAESMAIAEFLEETDTDKPLLPTEPLERARVREVCEFVNSTVHPAQNRTILGYLRPELDEGAKRNLRAKWISGCLEKLGGKLWLTSHFAVGDTFTIADIFVAVIYKKAIAHGALPIPAYEMHTAHLASNGLDMVV